MDERKWEDKPQFQKAAKNFLDMCHGDEVLAKRLIKNAKYQGALIMFTDNDNASQVEYENSPSIKFRESSQSFTRVLTFNFIFGMILVESLGVMEIVGGLKWLTNYENQCHAVHLMGIYVHRDCKGDGLFRSMMEILKSISEMYGVFIYFVARAYLINLPTIKTPEQFTHFINHKDDYFSYYHNKSTERHLSKELGKLTNDLVFVI